MATNSNAAGGVGGDCAPFATAAPDANAEVNWTQTQPPTCEPSTSTSPAATPLTLVGVSLTIPDSAVGKAWRPGTMICKPTKEEEDEEENKSLAKKRPLTKSAMEFALAASRHRDASVRGTSLAFYPEAAGDDDDNDDDDSLPAANLEQLLLGDTTAHAMPVHLRMLLQQSISRDEDLLALPSAELLFLLAFAGALESGFMPQDNAEYGSYLRLSSISSYNSQNVRRFSSRRPKYTSDERKTRFSIGLRTLVDDVHTAPEEQPQLLDSMLSGVVSGDLLIVTLTPDPATNQRGHSVCLSVPRYVHSSQPRDKPLQQRFQKLDELALKLREALFGPLRKQQMLLLGQHRFPALEGLPEELYDEVFRHLSDNQLNMVANVCRCLRDVARRSIERRCACPSVETVRCPC